MAKHRAYVYKDTEGIDGYRVYPPVVIIKANDDFELVNVSGDTATWKIPAGPFSDSPITESVPDKDAKSKKAKADSSGQAVEYVVIVNGKRAKANSDPVIIIDL